MPTVMIVPVEGAQTWRSLPYVRFKDTAYLHHLRRFASTDTLPIRYMRHYAVPRWHGRPARERARP